MVAQKGKCQKKNGKSEKKSVYIGFGKVRSRAFLALALRSRAGAQNKRST